VTRAEYNTMRAELTVIMPRISPSMWCDSLVASDATRALKFNIIIYFYISCILVIIGKRHSVLELWSVAFDTIMYENSWCPVFSFSIKLYSITDTSPWKWYWLCWDYIALHVYKGLQVALNGFIMSLCSLSTMNKTVPS